MDTNQSRENFSSSAQRKKKKKHVGLWVTLIIIFVLIIAPIGAIFALFYDNGKTNTTKDPNFKIADVLLDATVDSLDNTAQTGKISLNINENTFNQILLSTYEDIFKKDDTLSKYISSLSLETGDKYYTFILDVNLANFFNSRIRLVTEMKDEKVNNLSAYVFEIKDLKIGRLGGFYSVIKNNFSSLLNDQTINDMFNSFGLSFVSDLTNDRIYYYKDDVGGDITNIIGDSSALFKGVVNELFDEEHFSIAFNKNGMTGEVNLSSFAKNEAYVDDDKKLNVDWEKYKKITKQLLDKGIVSVDKAQELFEYLIKGASSSSYFAGDTSPLKDMNWDGYDIKIDDVSSYSGIYLPNGSIKKLEKDVKQIVQDQINIVDIYKNHHIATLNEEDLNSAIQTSSVIGTTYLLEREVSENNYKINTLIVSDMYTNIDKEGLKIAITLSINGYDTYICVDAKNNGFNPLNYTLSFDIEEIYYGEKAISEDFKNAIYNIISDGFEAGGKAIKFDKESHQIIVQFELSVDDSGEKTNIEAVGTPIVHFEGEKLSDEGKIIIDIDPNITFNTSSSFPKEQLIAYFADLGTKHKNDIIEFASTGDYRYATSKRSIDILGNKEEINTFVIDCVDKDYDISDKDNRHLFNDYQARLLAKGYSQDNATQTGNNYTMFSLKSADSKSTVIIGIMQIEDYFQAFYSIKSLI